MALLLRRDFYTRPTLTVAKELIGKEFVTKQRSGKLAGIIVEAEAYVGKSDPACHAAGGRTERNQVMFGPGGFSYIYFIYGMYHMLNFVVEREGFPAAVLIRAMEPVDGIRTMQRRRRQTGTSNLTNGPGKLCQAFGITRRDNGRDLAGSRWQVLDIGHTPKKIVSSPRIGINSGLDKDWRFYEADSKFVSRRG